MTPEGKKSWRENLVELFELPREIVLNLPRVTIIGNLQCYIENHRGVIEYSTEKVRISVHDGEIRIAGKDLVIRYLANEEIAVDGSIESVFYEK